MIDRKRWSAFESTIHRIHTTIHIILALANYLTRLQLNDHLGTSVNHQMHQSGLPAPSMTSLPAPTPHKSPLAGF